MGQFVLIAVDFDALLCHIPRLANVISQGGEGGGEEA